MTIQRIRKNAAKKIANLIEGATAFTLETHSMDMTDCMNSNGTTQLTANEFSEWFEEEYKGVQVWAKYDENGELEYVEFSGEYYFCPSVVVTFGKVETTEAPKVEKKRLTLAQVERALEFGYYSPLNSTEQNRPAESNVVEFPKVEKVVDEDKAIKSVFVEWSEGGIINKALRDGVDRIKKEITIERYESLANQQAIASNEEGCYDKTKVKVILEDGREFEFRHDINLNHRSLLGEWSAWVDYVRRESKAAN